jgi:hypothetical protein
MNKIHSIPAWRMGPFHWPFAVVMTAVLLSAGCGGQPADPSSTSEPGAEAEIVESQLTTGPCDKDHREQAIAAGRAALRKRVGHVSNQEPHAEFVVINVIPQALGQPAQAPSPGWLISYMAGGPIDDENGARNAIPLLSSMPLPQSISANGLPEVTLAAQQAPQGIAPDVGETGTMQAPPKSAFTMPDGTPRLDSRNAGQLVAPEGATGTSIRRYMVFVNVDGSVINM